jgi:peptidoglycan-N-acetylglucosamine deacetylase
LVPGVGWPSTLHANTVADRRWKVDNCFEEAVAMRRGSTLVTVILALIALAALSLSGCARRHPSAAPSISPSATLTAPPISPTMSPTSSRSPTPAPTTSRPTGTSPGPTRTTTPGIPAGLWGKDVEVIPTSQRVVALTFDAGANADALPSILATLSAHGIRATFFLTGDFAREFPASVRAITAAGHRIGNHTATHPHCTGLSDALLRQQISTAYSQITAAGGTDPRPLFRFPYGERDARTIAVVNNAGYVAVRWTVDSLGWQGLNGRSLPQATQFVADRVVAAARPGEIVLMHVGSNPDDHTTLDAAALPGIIDRLAAAGYRFVTLDTLVR